MTVFPWDFLEILSRILYNAPPQPNQIYSRIGHAFPLFVRKFHSVTHLMVTFANRAEPGSLSKKEISISGRQQNVFHSIFFQIRTDL